MPKAKTKIVKKPPQFKVTFRLAGESVSYTAPTIEEGLAQIDKERTMKAAKCSIGVEFGDKKAELTLPPLRIKRIYYNKIYRQILAKRILQIMK